MYLSCHMLPKCVVFINAATPKGVASYLYPALFSTRLVFEGNRFIRCRSFAHPLAMLPEPPRGFCQMTRLLNFSNPRSFHMTVLLNFRTSELLKSPASVFRPFAESPSSFRRTSVFLSANLRLPFADIPKVAFHHPMRLLIMSQPGVPYYILYTPFINQRLLIVYKPYVLLPSCHIFTLINSMPSY